MQLSKIGLSFLNHLSNGAFNREQLFTCLLATSALIFGITTPISLTRQPSLATGTAGNDTPPHNLISERLQSPSAEDGDLVVAARNSSDHSPISANETLTPTIYLPTVLVSPPVIKDLITQVNVMLPHPLAAATDSSCTWEWCTISPRLYHEPLVDDHTLLGWTDANGNGHVSVISNTIENTVDFTQSVHGLVAHDDGTFAVLLWDFSSGAMSISKRHVDGSAIWTTNIQGPLTTTDFWWGDSRLTYGNGKYAAYFTVRGVSGWVEGHFGDQLTYINDNGVIQADGWEWGCSHSMAQLVSYHPDLDQFIAICSSDCYASKGILIFDNDVVYNSDGNCRGLTSAQLGQVALSDQGWRLVFNALDMPCCDGRGIALATIGENFQSSYTWLTNTDGAYERDPAIARLGTNISSDRFLVGWTTTDDGVYWLGIIDGAGNFVVGPEEVTSIGVSWGNRDDSFRTRVDGSVSWVQGSPASTILHLFHLDGTAYLPSSVCNTPAIPNLVSPGNGSTINDTSPIFDWNSASHATEYQLQVDDNADFSSPMIDVTTANSDYTPTLGLSDDTYYWRVRGHNTGNGCDVYGSWTSVWSVSIDATIPTVDGVEEIVVVGTDGYVYAYDYQGNLVFKSPEGGWNHVATADLNKDGDKEIIAVGANTVKVYDPQVIGTPFNFSATYTNNIGQFTQVGAGNLISDDANPEIALLRSVGAEGYIVVYDPPDTSPKINQKFFTDWRDFAIGDYDGDEDDDFALIYWNPNGPSGFKNLMELREGHDPSERLEGSAENFQTSDSEWFDIATGNFRTDNDKRVEWVGSQNLGDNIIAQEWKDKKIEKLWGRPTAFTFVATADFRGEGMDQLGMLRNVSGNEVSLRFVNHEGIGWADVKNLGTGWLNLAAGNVDAETTYREAVILRNNLIRVYLRAQSIAADMDCSNENECLEITGSFNGALALGDLGNEF